MKTKNPLTVDSIVEILNSHNYSVEYLMNRDVNSPQRFKISDYNKVTQSFLDYYYDGYDIKDIGPYEDGLVGSFCRLNERLCRYYFDDMYRVEFPSLYPHIIAKLWKRGLITFSIDEFGHIYSFIMENRGNIKKHPNLSRESYLLLRVFLNFTFGVLFSKFSNFISCTNRSIIVDYTKDVFSELFEKYPKNIIYLDVDTIYLDYFTKEIKNELDKLDLPYEVEHNIGGLFTSVKKYITYEKDGIHVRGIQTYKSSHKMEKERTNKLRKIKSLING